METRDAGSCHNYPSLLSSSPSLPSLLPIGCELVRGYSTASSTAGSSAASYSTRPTILAYTPSATPGTTRVTWSPRYPTLSCPGVVHEACNGCTTPVLRSRNPPDSLTSSSFPHRCTLCEDGIDRDRGCVFLFPSFSKLFEFILLAENILLQRGVAFTLDVQSRNRRKVRVFI